MSFPEPLTPGRLTGLRDWLKTIDAGSSWRVLVLPENTDQEDAEAAAANLLDSTGHATSMMSVSSTCGALDCQSGGMRVYVYAGIDPSLVKWK